MWSYLKRTPVVFPLVAIFFVVLSIIDASLWIGDKRVDTIYWFKPAVIIVYTMLWIGAAMRRKWAATAFIIFSIAHLIIFLFFKENEVLQRILENAMVTPFPLALLFSGILLFYYRGMK